MTHDLREVAQQAAAALEILRSEQEGPPLIRRKVQWETAMQFAEASLRNLHSALQPPAIESTHAEGCWSWGPAHYLCAYNHIKKLEGKE